MSDWKKENYLGESNPNYGKRKTLEEKKMMVSRNSQTKLSNDNILEIKNLLIQGCLKDSEIAAKFHVSRTVITRIANGTRWANITGGKVLLNDRRGLSGIGKPRSEETKEKIRQAITGIKRSEETKAKISKSKRIK